MARFLRQPDVSARTGLKRATIYLWISQGRFPKPIPLGAGQVVVWLESEVDAWIASQIRVARGEPADVPSHSPAA